MARYILRTRKFIRDKILHTGDSPHRIALGVAVAVFVSLLPIPMSQTVVAIALAALLRANKAVCIPVVWVTNPLTAIPIWAFCLAIGQFVLDAPADAGIIARLHQFTALSWNVFDSTFWTRSIEMLVHVGIDLWVGCVIVGLASAVASYFLARWAVTVHREHRHQRTIRRHHFRARIREAKLATSAGSA